MSWGVWKGRGGSGVPTRRGRPSPAASPSLSCPPLSPSVAPASGPPQPSSLGPQSPPAHPAARCPAPRRAGVRRRRGRGDGRGPCGSRQLLLAARRPPAVGVQGAGLPASTAHKAPRRTCVGDSLKVAPDRMKVQTCTPQPAARAQPGGHAGRAFRAWCKRGTAGGQRWEGRAAHCRRSGRCPGGPSGCPWR